jgi:tripartite-type tricarboxylate transporter receptor subunit TctC
MKHIIIIFSLLFSTLSYAWEPTKPIIVTIGFAPGSGNETAFRKVSEIVHKNTGANFVVENRPGADTIIAMNHLITLPADGYNISVPSQMSTYVTNDIWEKNIKKFNYDSFTDVITIGKSPLVLVASSKSKVNTPMEFLKFTHSGKAINIAIGTGAHRAAYEIIAHKLNFTSDVQFIKFNGPLPALTSVAQFDGAGTEFGIMPITVARPLIDAGKVKPIAFTGSHKLSQYKEVPLLQDLIPNINVYAAWFIALPPKTDTEIVSWYRTQFKKALLSKEYQEWATTNLVIIDAKEFTENGIKENRESLRKHFLPILEKIDLK